MSYSKTGLIRYVYWCNNGIDVTGVTNHSVNYWGAAESSSTDSLLRLRSVASVEGRT